MRLEAEFGAIDIYLFDQILRDRIRPDDRVVDVGCGFGRNLVYLMRMGCELFGVDSDPDATWRPGSRPGFRRRTFALRASSARRCPITWPRWP
jgi:SAM-dependent methyltransferase